LVGIARGLMFGEGRVWDQRNKWLYYVDIIGNKKEWVPGVGSQVVLGPSGHLNGMTLDSENRLIIAGWSSRNIWRLEHDTCQRNLIDLSVGRGRGLDVHVLVLRLQAGVHHRASRSSPELLQLEPCAVREQSPASQWTAVSG
jgi:hypothetical protein